jgi:pantoate--beta-alanine ligase
MALDVAATVADLRAAVRRARDGGLTVGLVPTMGALHEGHASLIRLARQECGFVAVSIFVNPTQFGPNEDLDRYPRTWDADLATCAAAGAALVFAPPVAEVYPPGFCTYVEVTELQRGLCGASRPGHFRGVATVVLKLLLMAQPDAAYFGQKDAQQVRVIQQLVSDLNVPAAVRVGPTVREPDGLALSSRNRYLTPAERAQASVLFRALEAGREAVAAGEQEAAAVLARVRDVIATAPDARIDYVELVDHATLRPAERLEGEVLAALAVKFGGTRLIDNQVWRIG